MNTNNIGYKSEESILTSLGENYYYLKTILSNKIEITKLEFLHKISGLVSLLIFSIIAMFTMMTIFTIFIVSLVVYFAGVFGSYLFALLLVNGILIILSMMAYFLIKPKITLYLERKMMYIIEKKKEEE